MKAMILAAGLGTRLRPWTLKHPKALAPVAGIPMLERVILNLKKQGFNHIVVNVHHFASQIMDFLNSKDFGVEVIISDESERLLDTGGGILYAENHLNADDSPFLVHNVDILTSTNLKGLVEAHNPEDIATLLVSNRESSRVLVFDSEKRLAAWMNLKENKTLPPDFEPDETHRRLAFSGIYVLSPTVFPLMKEQAFQESFPIMDFFLNNINSGKIKGHMDGKPDLIDIGKPETLSRANQMLLSNIQSD